MRCGLRQVMHASPSRLEMAIKRFCFEKDSQGYQLVGFIVLCMQLSNDSVYIFSPTLKICFDLFFQTSVSSIQLGSVNLRYCSKNECFVILWMLYIDSKLELITFMANSSIKSEYSFSSGPN